MFDDFLPKRKIGVLSPLPIIDNSAYQLYHIAPEGVMFVFLP